MARIIYREIYYDQLKRLIRPIVEKKADSPVKDERYSIGIVIYPVDILRSCQYGISCKSLK